MKDQEKDPVAQSMVAKRWAKTTPEERSKLGKELSAARWGPKKAGAKKKGGEKKGI